jgi:hypothetical protein
VERCHDFSRYNKQTLYVQAQSYNIVIDIINSILERASELALFKLPIVKIVDVV